MLLFPLLLLLPSLQRERERETDGHTHTYIEVASIDGFIENSIYIYDVTAFVHQIG